MSSVVQIDPSRRVIQKKINIDGGLASGLSGPIALDGFTPVGLFMPDAWTAAALTFAVADTEGGTYVPAYDAGSTELTLATIAAGHYIGFSQALQQQLKGVQFLKLRSGTAVSPVSQAAGRALILVAAVTIG